ncbi:hypothetical protein AAMO2058_001424900 [Amorphochlora amoebiformis]
MGRSFLWMWGEVFRKKSWSHAPKKYTFPPSKQIFSSPSMSEKPIVSRTPIHIPQKQRGKREREAKTSTEREEEKRKHMMADQ